MGTQSEGGNKKGWVRLLQNGIEKRQLKKYPLHQYRIALLIIVVIANIIASYEGNLSPVLPMLLPDLGMTASLYGQLSAVTLVITALFAVLMGPLADRFGRAIFVIIGTLLTALFIFLLAGVTTVTGYFIVKIFLGMIDGLALAPIAGLIRDFSPQMGRALAFGFWTMGPVGGPFIANAIASWTLPIFGTWQSQLYIMGGVSIVLWFVIFLLLRDLSPELRAQVVVSEADAAEINDRAIEKKTPDEMKQNVRLSLIFSHRFIWLQPIGIALFLQLYFTMLVYGPLFFTEAYGVSAAQGSRFTMFVWMGAFIGLIGAGWLSDRLGMRKIVTFTCAIATVIVIPVWILFAMGPDTPSQWTTFFAFLTGLTTGAAYSPWMAMFSENLEEIDPKIQSTGWGMFGFIVRIETLMVALFAPMIVAWMGSWNIWFWISEAVMLVYMVFPFFAKGPWVAKAKQAPVIVHGKRPEI